MSVLTNLFSGGASNLIDTLSNVVDKFTLSKEEKQQFKIEMQGQIVQAEKAVEESYQKALDARAEIIKAEMVHGDTFTKRARPTIIYAGLIFISIAYIIVPIIAAIGGNTAPKIVLPPEFWYAWTTVVGVYGAGRTAEKLGTVNKLTNLATGSNAHKINKDPNSVG